MPTEEAPQTPPQEAEPAKRGYVRRPPLAEIDTWELWQEWRTGDRAKARPWFVLMLGFCVVLAAMIAFFFYSTAITNDTVAQVGLLIVLVGFLFAIWRRISPRRGFALYVTAAIAGVAGLVFGLWYLVFALTGYSAWFATLGTPVLGLIGLGIGLGALNGIGRNVEGTEP
jgi:hypothetical protein